MKAALLAVRARFAGWFGVWLVVALWALALDGRAGEQYDVYSEGRTFMAHIQQTEEDSLVVDLYRVAGSQKTVVWSGTLSAPPFMSPPKVLVADDGAAVVLENHDKYQDWALCFFDAKGKTKLFSLAEALGAGALEATKAVPAPERTESLDLESLARMRAEQGKAMSQGSLWNEEGSVSFLDTEQGRTVYCLWIGGRNDWLAWSVADAAPIKPNASQKARWNDRARQWALQEVRQSSTSELKEWIESAKSVVRDSLHLTNQAGGVPWHQQSQALGNAAKFIARQRKPEDRRAIEQILASRSFSTGYGSTATGVGKKMICLSLSSPDRILADQLLARWDGKTPVEQGLQDDVRTGQVYVYLGTVRGQVEFPLVPENGNVWVYLIPGEVGVNQWSSRRLPMILSCDVRFAADTIKHPRSSGTPSTDDAGYEPVNRIAFSLEGVPPGRYRLKAIWEKQPPFVRGTKEMAIPKPGDYESVESKEFQITAGTNLVEVLLVCTNRVGNKPALYAADTRALQTASAATKAAAAERDDPNVDGGDVRRTATFVTEEWTPPASTSSTNTPVVLSKVTYGLHHTNLRITHETDTPSLVVWFVCAQRGLDPFRLRCVLLDEHGCKFQPNSSVSISGDKGEARCMIFDTFPRRQATVKATFSDEDKPVGEFSIPNLAGLGETREWTPGPLPSTKELGDGLTVTCERIRAVSGRPPLTVRRQDQPQPEWELESFAFQDPTGNEARSVLAFCRKEPVLNVTTTWSRQLSGDFQDDEQWEVKGLTVPEAGRIVPLSLTNRLQGLTLQLVALGGTGEIIYSNGVPTACRSEFTPGAQPIGRTGHSRHGSRAGSLVFINGVERIGISVPVETLAHRRTVTVVSKVPHVAVRIKGLTERHVVSLVGSEEVRERHGRLAVHRNLVQASGHHRDVYFLPLPEGARQGAISLKFVVQKTRAVEFVFKNPASEEESPRIKQLRARAEKGDAAAQYELACRLRIGDEVAEDYEEEDKWIRRAAEGGNSWAQYELGLQRDGEDDGLGWLRKAAEQGVAEAQVDLGRRYRDRLDGKEEPVGFCRASGEGS